MDHWALFADERPPVLAMAPMDETLRSAPHASILLHATDEERGSFLVFGAAVCAVVLLLAGLLAGDVDSAPAAGAWALAVIAAAAGTVWALWSRVTRRPAEYVLDDRGIARHMRRPHRADEITLLRWDEVTFYRDTADIDRAALLAVGHNGARIWLHEPNPSERTQQFIREFVDSAERRSPLDTSSPLDRAANRLGLVGTGVVLLVTGFVLRQLSPEAQETGTAVAVLLVFLVHAYVVLTDDDQAYEDRRSPAWDAQLRDSLRRTLGIEPT
ncbi:MAG TPA: hypothetical protein VF665_13125 [Longimicrobium sp.]|uniref:hypothetical protein n=1 Tax=Longimicrobium sp. TaxID=2029185 RepID=UPI002ED9FE6D